MSVNTISAFPGAAAAPAPSNAARQARAADSSDHSFDSMVAAYADDASAGDGETPAAAGTGARRQSGESRDDEAPADESSSTDPAETAATVVVLPVVQPVSPTGWTLLPQGTGAPAADEGAGEGQTDLPGVVGPPVPPSAATTAVAPRPASGSEIGQDQPQAFAVPREVPSPDPFQDGAIAPQGSAQTAVEQAAQDPTAGADDASAPSTHPEITGGAAALAAALRRAAQGAARTATGDKTSATSRPSAADLAPSAATVSTAAKAAANASLVGAAAGHVGPSLITHAAPAADFLAAVAPDGALLPDTTVQDLVQSLRLRVLDGGGEATIRLEPQHFGDVRVSLRVDDGQVVARVVAESSAVRDWLQNNQSWLRAQLAEQQLTLDRLEVREPAESQEPNRGDAERRTRDEQRRQRRMRQDGTASAFEVVA